MDLQTVLGHPRVAATRFEGDQNLAAVFLKAFSDEGNEFPIDLDEVWRFVGYASKADGILKLKHEGFKEGVDYTVRITRTVRKHYMTAFAFESFTMVAMSETGDDVRLFFRAFREACDEVAQELQRSKDRKQAQMIVQNWNMEVEKRYREQIYSQIKMERFKQRQLRCMLKQIQTDAAGYFEEYNM